MLETNPAVAPDSADALPPERYSLGRAAAMPRANYIPCLVVHAQAVFSVFPPDTPIAYFPASIRTQWLCMH